ncbi:MAG: DUF3455 domain-containing protein [Rubrivivax sp.]
MRSYPVSALVSIAAAAALTACGSMSPPMASSMPAPYSQAAVPAAVQVPAGHKVALETVGVGEITYECQAKADAPGGHAWVFVGPKADLNSRAGVKLGSYYGPPATWASTDGSRITGKQLALAPGAAGSIPMQLVQANPAEGSGAMNGVTYVQRVATRGGVAPSLACAAASMGRKEIVKYQADYIFWKAA